LGADGLNDDNARSDRHTPKKIDDILIHEPNASAGYGMADCVGLVGAMDTEQRAERVNESETAGVGI
jgi:hypothetical protein